MTTNKLCEHYEIISERCKTFQARCLHEGDKELCSMYQFCNRELNKSPAPPRKPFHERYPQHEWGSWND